MTLIVGTSHWNGICINSDTRATNRRSGKFIDNVQKIAHIHGGIGMVASGDKSSAIMVRETIRQRLNEFADTNIKFPQRVDLQKVIQKLLLSSLKKLRKHPFKVKNPSYKIFSKGLIGVNVNDQPLTLNQEESRNLIKIIIEGKKINWIYQKNIDQISKCANGHISKAVLKDFHQNSLYSYKVNINDKPINDIYEVKKVPFGKILAFGSGSDFDYKAIESKTLSYVLFSSDADDIWNASFHLGIIHEAAESKVGINKHFKIKTFGGAVVAGAISTDASGMGSTKILMGEFGLTKTREIISKVFKKNGKLWITTRSGVSHKLEPFPDKLDKKIYYLWTSN